MESLLTMFNRITSRSSWVSLQQEVQLLPRPSRRKRKNTLYVIWLPRESQLLNVPEKDELWKHSTFHMV